MKVLFMAAVAAAMPGVVQAGPLAYAACQAACATSLTAGPAGAAIYAACQSACAPLLAMPCP